MNEAASGATVSHALDVVGLMSGTSIDGIDVARVRTDGETLERTGTAGTFAYRDETVDGIRAAIAAGSLTATARERFASLERLIAEDHATALAGLIGEPSARTAPPRLLGFHGQSVFHSPSPAPPRRVSGAAPASVAVQLGDAAWLASLTGIDVVHDFRTADVARGGEGAPLAPHYQSIVPDALATLAAITVGAAVDAIARLPGMPRTLVVAGGGQHNGALLAGLRTRLGIDVHRADDVGLPGDFLEAELVALLAVRHLRGLPLTFPTTTGVDAPCLGGQFAPAPRDSSRGAFAVGG